MYVKMLQESSARVSPAPCSILFALFRSEQNP